VEAEHPFVLALGCLHHVIPLPPALARFAPPPTAQAPAGNGEVIRTFRSALARRHPVAIFRDVFNPPDWWLHAYYGVPIGQSLTAVRLGRHPWRVARWLGFRAAGF
jgi:hypothetical protein